MFTKEQMAEILPKCPSDKLATYHKALVDAMTAARVTTLNRVACCIGQLALESGEFRYVREIWNPEKVPNQTRYERNFAFAWPPSAADQGNKLAYRLGNSEKGDGYSFRGWGPIQNTGRGNTAKASQALYGDDRLIRDPKLLDDPAIGFQGALWYWTDRHLNDLADAGNIEAITKAINGGLTHHDLRVQYTQKALFVLGRGTTIIGTANLV